MVDDDFILDEETLYRSVRKQESYGEYYFDDNNKLIITHDAFRDRNKEPSVDRAKLHNFNPALSKLNDTDGIVSLIAVDIRAIGDVKTEDVCHAVDVVYDPIHNVPINLAHSQITVEPKFFGSNSKQNKVFKLLRIALARLATQGGWTLPPVRPDEAQQNPG
jgi:hypothetical protein